MGVLDGHGSDGHCVAHFAQDTEFGQQGSGKGEPETSRMRRIRASGSGTTDHGFGLGPGWPCLKSCI